MLSCASNCEVCLAVLKYELVWQLLVLRVVNARAIFEYKQEI
jgi:hypothetical protein